MGLEVQIIHTKPIFDDVEIVSVYPIKKNPRISGTHTMGKGKDNMIIEISFHGDRLMPSLDRLMTG
jgi:hypothetical protein